VIGRKIRHFEIVERLGEGGMGAVYKAWDQHLDRAVALKVLLPETVADPDRRRRFVQEAASALNQPNIIHIYDIDEADGALFIAMEYVSGKTLDQVIARKGLPRSEALQYASRLRLPLWVERWTNAVRDSDALKGAVPGRGGGRYRRCG
jgi:eukaryotic-like serine/threonine-protein kinase